MVLVVCKKNKVVVVAVVAGFVSEPYTAESPSAVAAGKEVEEEEEVVVVALITDCASSYKDYWSCHRPRQVLASSFLGDVVGASSSIQQEGEERIEEEVDVQRLFLHDASEWVVVVEAAEEEYP